MTTKTDIDPLREGKSECYISYTREELFDLIERIRARCNYYMEVERRKEDRKKHKIKPL